jgi:hypothetical protein
MPPRPETITRHNAVCHALRTGSRTTEATRSQGYKTLADYLKTLQNWPDLRAEFEEARATRNAIKTGKRLIDDMDLETFRKKVLGRATFTHQRQWVEWMEDPEADHIMIVTCPDTAKSTTVLDYVLYDIARNPDIRISYASLSERQAQKNLARVKGVIESNKELRKVAGEMCPGPGDPHPWANTHFMVRQRNFSRGEDEADATMRAYGMGSQIASTRADKFVIDDPDQEGLSAREREEIFEKIMMTVESRLTIGGKLIIILNRWGDGDVASRIMDEEKRNPGSWKIHVSPAIIREGSPNRLVRDKLGRPRIDPDWGDVIWPEKFGAMTNVVGDRWSHERAWEFFAKKRRRLGVRRFNIQYQNDPEATEDREFTEDDINKALERGKGHRWGHVPPDSLVICALDPAGETGGSAVIAMALTQAGPVLVDAEWGRNTGHSGLLTWIGSFNRYLPKFWGIETQGGFSMLKDDKTVLDAIRPAYSHFMHTNQNKHAAGVGVTSLVQVLQDELIIPSERPEDVERFQRLIDQLKAYKRPKWDEDLKKEVQVQGTFDLVMALWLAFRVVREKNVQRPPSTQDRSAWTSPFGNTWNGGTWALKPAGERVRG